MPELPSFDEPTLPINEFADRLGVRPGTVKRWRSEGMPSRFEAGEVVALTTEAIDWIRKHARPSSFSKRAVVYFARKNDLIKIGSSVDPVDRLRKMHVEILATVPGDKRTELAFHELFSFAATPVNEWFAPAPELLELIESFRKAA